MAVVDSMFVAVAKLFGRPMCASVEYAKGEFVIGYREGRDVCVIARGQTWEDALFRATDRVNLVDRLVTDTGSDNAAVATAASVPVRFVRIRRRDVKPPMKIS
jgi:hypothetical protein